MVWLKHEIFGHLRSLLVQLAALNNVGWGGVVTVDFMGMGHESAVLCVPERDPSVSSLHPVCDQVQSDAQRQLDCSYTWGPADDGGGE